MKLPEGSLDLIKFLAATWVDLEAVRLKAIKSEDPKKVLQGEWPVIQGNSIRIALNKLARQKADSKLAAKALQELGFGD